MKSVESVPELMTTRSRFAGDATGFNIELACLGERSALKPLLEVIAGERILTAGALNAVGLFLPDAQARSAILEKLETFRGPQMDTGEQSSAITVLALRDPGPLVDRVSELYRSGRLHRRARQKMASLMPQLIRTEKEHDIRSLN